MTESDALLPLPFPGSVPVLSPGSGQSGPLPARSPARLSARLPWEIHPALSEDRLRICAAMLANARRDAVRMASPEMGDDSWSIGCRAYSFGRRRLARAAERGTYNWLTVLDESHHFVFLIEDVPVRFFRGAADGPTPRTLRRQAVEAEQLGLALGQERAEGLVFRFALEAEAAAGVDRVVFLALRGEDGEADCFWPVPLEPDGQGDRADDPPPTQLRLLGDDAVERVVMPRRARRPVP